MSTTTAQLKLTTNNGSLYGMPDISVEELERSFNRTGKPVPELLYLIKTGIVPSTRRYVSVNISSAISELCRKFDVNRQTVPSDDFVFLNKDQSRSGGAMVFLLNDLLLVGMSPTEDLLVLYPPGERSKELEAIDLIVKGLPAQKNGFHVLGAIGENFVLSKCQLDDGKTDLAKYFNDDIISADQIIRQKLMDPQSRGLVMLHGEPGTGKSTYLKHLLATLDSKSVLVPADFIYGMHSPVFVTFLNQFKELIVVLEDIDDFISEGNGGTSQYITNLVNSTDSLLSRHINLRFICTFSISIDKIAKPLRRSGRILSSYEFKPLTLEKCNVILDELRPGCKTEHELPLADVFHFCENTEARPKSPRIGFTRANAH